MAYRGVGNVTCVTPVTSALDRSQIRGHASNGMIPQSKFFCVTSVTPVTPIDKTSGKQWVWEVGPKGPMPVLEEI